MKWKLLILVPLAILLSHTTKYIFAQELPCSRTANYQIDVSLNVDEKILDATERLTWRNTSDIAVNELYFHLYWNAFKNTRSTFAKESLRMGGWAKRMLASFDEDDWGWIDITSFHLLSSRGSDNTDLLPNSVFVAPDDNNKHDRTVLKVTLPRTVAPGQSIVLDIAFQAKIPSKAPRVGYVNDTYFIAQWFPKIGVIWGGKWNCHQYHSNSEYFSDYGDYDVKITVPQGFIVGATGAQTDSTSNAEGMVTYQFQQECVHDFAWTTSPNYQVRSRMFTHDELSDVKMRLLFQAEHTHHADKLLDATENTLKYYGLWYGAYPYNQITIVDPPESSTAIGMEYPTLFTTTIDWWLPKGAYGPHSLTIHECGHSWWYGLVGSNEFEHAWIDEGFNTYATSRCLNASYGNETYHRRYFGIPVRFREVRITPQSDLRESYLQYGAADIMDQLSWEFINGSSYGALSYNKAALMLWTLEGYLGEQVFSKIMKEFSTRFWFKHPHPQDFFNIVNEYAPENMDWFFEQIVYGSEKLDYAIGSIKSEPVSSARGWFDENGEKIYSSGEKKEKDDEEVSEELFDTEIIVKRLGGVKFPVEVRFAFEDGEVLTDTWDGNARWKVFRYRRPAKLMLAEVDPDRKIALDTNYTNNSKYVKRASTPALKWTARWFAWFQHLMEMFSFFS